MLDLALEIVDRLVDAVHELEEGVGGVVDSTVEDAAAGRAGVDPRRDAVHGRDIAARACLAHGDDRRGCGDHIELQVLHAPFAGMRDGMGEDREHVVPVTLEQRPDVAAVARRPVRAARSTRVDATPPTASRISSRLGSTRSVQCAPTAERR